MMFLFIFCSFSFLIEELSMFFYHWWWRETGTNDCSYVFRHFKRIIFRIILCKTKFKRRRTEKVTFIDWINRKKNRIQIGTDTQKTWFFTSPVMIYWELCWWCTLYKTSNLERMNNNEINVINWDKLHNQINVWRSHLNINLLVIFKKCFFFIKILRLQIYFYVFIT